MSFSWFSKSDFKAAYECERKLPYLKIGADGKPFDRCKVLPPLPLAENEADENAVTEGTGAIRIYQDLFFRQDNQPGFPTNHRVLLEQACRLDTAALLMIWKH